MAIIRTSVRALVRAKTRVLVRERVRSLVTDSVRVLGRDSGKSLVKKSVGASLRGELSVTGLRWRFRLELQRDFSCSA